MNVKLEHIIVSHNRTLWLLLEQTSSSHLPCSLLKLALKWNGLATVLNNLVVGVSFTFCMKEGRVMTSTRKFEIIYRPVIEPKFVRKLDSLVKDCLFIQIRISIKNKQA